MLRFELTTPAGLEWRWDGTSWTDGTSLITPYRHPMLEHFAVREGQTTFVTVRERRSNRNNDREPSTLRQWPLDFVIVECSPRGFRLHASQWGTAPLYLSEVGNILHGSWSVSDLRSVAALSALDDLVVTRLLTEQTRYSRRTLFRGVRLLTERACATYDDHGLALTYPEPAEHAAPRDLRPGIDVVSVYERCLRDAVFSRPINPQATAVELSGGMDSAAVAATLAERCRGAMHSYALAIGGTAGDQQLRRRTEMLRDLAFTDFTCEALSVPPLAPGGDRAQGRFVEPSAEPFHEAVATVLREAGTRGIHTVFTGDGGDELLSLRGAEWLSVGKVRGRYAGNRRTPPWLGKRALDLIDDIDEDLAPQTVLNESALLGFALRSPQFLDAGLWPVSPLCSPQLIRFAEQLPVAWRDDKRICRERLRRTGFSDDVVRPRLRENFRHVMEYGLTHFGIPILAELAREAAVVDLGYVDGDGLRAELDRVRSGGLVDTMIFPVLSLELVLRALGRPCT